MTLSDAARRLIRHAQPERGSFLDMLRPYHGLRREILDDLWSALRGCAENLREASIDRELVSALWTISHFGHSWALEPNGMLQRNGLISDEDQQVLREFLDQFDHCVMALLDGSEEIEAFEGWRSNSG